MAVKLRLTRIGATKAPFYRIVAMDSRKSRDGQCLETLGYYDPTKNPVDVKINAESALKWLKTGAQPTETVRSLLKKNGIIE
ncbi:MAG: 30S ribosomal protein S16 [Clostridia bacterium]